jgi:hypothetical protein
MVAVNLTILKRIKKKRLCPDRFDNTREFSSKNIQFSCIILPSSTLHHRICKRPKHITALPPPPPASTFHSIALNPRSRTTASPLPECAAKKFSGGTGDTKSRASNTTQQHSNQHECIRTRLEQALQRSFTSAGNPPSKLDDQTAKPSPLRTTHQAADHIIVAEIHTPLPDTAQNTVGTQEPQQT